jgi:glycosyltransferase involved in cell wall biosynthesis
MNILLVIADLGVGGAQQVVINLANEFVRQSHRVWIFDVYPDLRVKGMVERMDSEVKLVSKNYNELRLSKKDKVVDFLFNKISVKQNRNKILFKYHEKNLYSILSKTEIDIVNSHICWADYFVNNNLKNLHNKWVISLHSSYFEWSNKFLTAENSRRKIINDIFCHAKGVTYLISSEVKFIKSNLTSPPLYKLKKILNGVPKPVIKRKYKKEDFEFHEKDFVLVCVSRAIEEKGWKELAIAVNQVILKEKKLKLIFVGDGPFLSKMKDNYESKSIKFLGFKKDVLEVIAISDLVVLPSYFEALPTTLIEAVFLDKPILATNVGETIKIVQNKKGNCGNLLSASKEIDLINELIKEIIFFSKPRVLKRFFKRESFEEAKKIFSIENMAYNYIQFYNSIK